MPEPEYCTKIVIYGPVDRFLAAGQDRSIAFAVLVVSGTINY